MCTWDSSLIVGIIGVIVVEQTKGNFLNAKKKGEIISGAITHQALWSLTLTATV